MYDLTQVTSVPAELKPSDDTSPSPHETMDGMGGGDDESIPVARATRTSNGSTTKSGSCPRSKREMVLPKK
jgi:hypothetical protein